MRRSLSSDLLVVPLVAFVASWSPAASAAEDIAAQEGKEIYSDNCATCHGEQLRNTSGGVTFDLRRLRPDEHERFVNSVLNGKNQMPPWRGVLEMDQIEDIWAYVRATVDH
jgi:mono/diheme cytochrome c family protein